MGYYSFILNQNLSLKDIKLKEEFEKWLKENEYEAEITEDGEVRFSDEMFNGWKIIGYWFDEFRKELKEMAKFLEGVIILYGEDYEVFAKIDFSDGNVVVEEIGFSGNGFML